MKSKLISVRIDKYLPLSPVTVKTWASSAGRVAYIYISQYRFFHDTLRFSVPMNRYLVLNASVAKLWTLESKSQQYALSYAHTYCCTDVKKTFKNLKKR